MIRRSQPIRRRVKPVFRRSRPRRVSAYRDPDYLAWVRERKCLVCLATPCDACHTKVNGTGSKGPDSSCVPLCRKHHQEQHRIGVKDFEARYDLNLQREAAMHFDLYGIARENTC